MNIQIVLDDQNGIFQQIYCSLVGGKENCPLAANIPTLLKSKPLCNFENFLMLLTGAKRVGLCHVNVVQPAYSRDNTEIPSP